MARAEGLMAFYADIEGEHVEDFRRWHNCEHMEERVALPGFLHGRRYRGYEGAPDFLMTYETETPAVLASEPYHAALNDPTPWTREALGWFRTPARAIYGLVAETGSEHWRPTPYLFTARFNVLEAVEDDFVNGIGPRLAGDPVDGKAVTRGRLWRVDEPISGMMTSERRIYGGGPGDQKYLMTIEIVAPFESLAADRLPTADAFAEAGCTDLFVDRFSIDFALDPPPA